MKGGESPPGGLGVYLCPWEYLLRDYFELLSAFRVLTDFFVYGKGCGDLLGLMGIS
jgi:hypothetical protein